LKQIKVINGGSYSNDDRFFFKGVIYTNIIQSMQAILEAMDLFGISFSCPATANHHASVVFMQHTNLIGQELSAEVFLAVRTLWDDAGVRACFQRCSEFHVCDAAQ
jgi:hypothetical protein